MYSRGLHETTIQIKKEGVFTHKGALVVLAQVGDEGGKGIIFVIVIMGHSDTSLSLRRRLFPMGLRLALVGTFLPALFQPFFDGGLFSVCLSLGRSCSHSSPERVR